MQKYNIFSRIILLSHEKSAFRGIFLTIQVIFWNKQHTPETQYRITAHEIHSNIFSHFCIKWYMRFHPISLPFSQKYLFNSSVRIRPKGVKRLPAMQPCLQVRRTNGHCSQYLSALLHSWLLKSNAYGISPFSNRWLIQFKDIIVC